MSATGQMSLADVKNRLSEVVDRFEREHGRVVITKHGHPAAVVISVEDLEFLEATLDIMGSEALPADIREALAEFGSVDAPVLRPNVPRPAHGSADIRIDDCGVDRVNDA